MQFPVDITDDGQTLLVWEGSGLWELSLSGENEPVQLIESAPWGGRVSPDGRWFAYGSNRSGQRQIYLFERGASGGEFQITVDGGRAPRWDPREGERQLYYVRDENQVWGVDLSTDERVAEPEPVILFETGKPIEHLEVMPDGERFLVRYGERVDQPISVLLRGGE